MNNKAWLHGRPREGERLTPDAPHSCESTGSPQTDHSPSGPPAHMRGTLRGPGFNAGHQPAKV